MVEQMDFPGNKWCFGIGRLVLCFEVQLQLHWVPLTQSSGTTIIGGYNEQMVFSKMNLTSVFTIFGYNEYQLLRAHCYRSQTKSRKVMFLYLSVIQFTRGGGSLSRVILSWGVFILGSLAVCLCPGEGVFPGGGGVLCPGGGSLSRRRSLSGRPPSYVKEGAVRILHFINQVAHCKRNSIYTS